MIKEIELTLKEYLKSPEAYTVINESRLHKGHKHIKNLNAVTHVTVHIAWHGFKGLSILKRHQLVNSWLAPFFEQGLHGARYILKVPLDSQS